MAKRITAAFSIKMYEKKPFGNLCMIYECKYYAKTDSHM